MFYLKILKADGSLVGTYKSLDACRKRLQALSDRRGANLSLRARGEVSAIPKLYDGAVITVSALLAELPQA
jgi:hypothetical protein